VADLEAGCRSYVDSLQLTRRTHSFLVESQGVRVCFLELAPHFYLELVSPATSRARLAPYLKVGFYHLCFLVDDLDAARERLKSRDFSSLPPFTSEAFDGARCQFFVNPQRHLIELAQLSAAHFDSLFRSHLKG
jgi:hypothetical protein